MIVKELNLSYYVMPVGYGLLAYHTEGMVQVLLCGTAILTLAIGVFWRIRRLRNFSVGNNGQLLRIDKSNEFETCPLGYQNDKPVDREPLELNLKSLRLIPKYFEAWFYLGLQVASGLICILIAVGLMFTSYLLTSWWTWALVPVAAGVLYYKFRVKKKESPKEPKAVVVDAESPKEPEDER